MPPKKEIPASQSLAHTEKEPWRIQIENAVINDANWNAKIVLIESSGGDHDCIYLNKFETFSAQEKRFVIKNICKTETMFMVNQLGAEKKVKSEKLKVFEEGQSYLKNKLPIPADVQALIIKHILLKMKSDYLLIQRQRLEVSEGMRKESLTMMDKTKAPDKGKALEAKTSHSASFAAESIKKYNTALRMRGEEWRDKIYVDDYPLDGPQLYIAITGFLDPYLPQSLIKIGVTLNAIVQIRINPIKVRLPSALARPTKRGQSQTDFMSDKCIAFWEELQMLRILKETEDCFTNTAFIVFSPPYWESESLTGDADQIYDEICYLMYDIQDLTRQHLHYLDNMDIFHITESRLNETYGHYYNQLIQDVPLECVTMYLVLDNILQSIHKFNEQKDKSASSSVLTNATTSFQEKVDNPKKQVAENFVNAVFNTLCKTEENRAVYRTDHGEEYEQYKDPLVIDYGNFAKYPTFHLENLNIDEVVRTSLVDMPINKLWNNQVRPIDELEAKVNFHVNVLLSCFEREDVETAELNRLMHILACRKLFSNRSSLKRPHISNKTVDEFKKAYLNRSQLAEPIHKIPSLIRNESSVSQCFPSMTKSENVSSIRVDDDPETRDIKLLFDCPDISELVSAVEITNEEPIDSLIDDFEFFEDFSGTNAFQILRNAFNKFNCVDYKYCEVTDCIIMMFYNSHDKDGISREEWRCHLSTPVCLQDFFDFVLQEEYEWVKNEERIYDKSQAMKAKSENQDLFDTFATISCITDTNIRAELLLEDSLKFKESEPDDKREVKVGPSVSIAGKLSSKSRILEKQDLKRNSHVKPSKRVKSVASRHASPILNPSSLQKPFSGYDISNRRVEVIGKDASFFSKDGTKVSTAFTLLIPNNMEQVTLNVIPGGGCNEFWFHKDLGEYTTPNILDKYNSFQIINKHGGIITIKKINYAMPVVQPLHVSVTDILEEPVTEQRSVNSFYVTWPNGQITHSVHDENGPKIMHIKQLYTIPQQHLDETHRCVSLNGEVIIFKKSGIIEVLRPNSSLIKVFKCEKKNILLDDDSDSSGKSKKSKGNLKKAKLSAKSKDKVDIETKSNVVFNVVGNVEYVYDEYEIIEASGLRQRWVNEIPFNMDKLLIRMATDFCLGEVFSRRSDGTYMLLNKDGVHVVTFPDKTRIITHAIIEPEEIFPEWTSEDLEFFDNMDVETEPGEQNYRSSTSQKSYPYSHESELFGKQDDREIGPRKFTEGYDSYVSIQLVYTIEHTNFCSVSINQSTGKISISSPNNTTLTVDSDIHYEMQLGNTTVASCKENNLHIKYEACNKCKSFTTIDIRTQSNIEDKPEYSSEESSDLQKHWLTLKDSFNKKIVVSEEGEISIKDDVYSQEMLTKEEVPEDEVFIEEGDQQIEAENISNQSEHQPEDNSTHNRCREISKAKAVKFFVLNRDLTCSEIVHKSLVEEYEASCRWQPWCSINHYDTFGDFRSVLSILSPVRLTESEKWLMESSLSDKPKYLKYKDLKKDTGKGFFHWMRPYQRFEPKPIKPESVLPARLPRAFILRTLEQQWSDENREKLKGARELVTAILRYRRLMALDMETLLTIPIIDTRTEEEVRTDDLIQAIGNRLYESLKKRTAAYAKERSILDITTKPRPTATAEEKGESAEEEDAHDALRVEFEEDREKYLRELEKAENTTENLKKYWRRRAEEFKEELFFKYLLREDGVPPYFRNVLGGAIWWEANHMMDEAVMKAEKKKMKCICNDETAASNVRQQATHSMQ